MKDHIENCSVQEKRKSDALMNYFLSVYFAIGLLLACYYDTWIIAIGVGGLSLMIYYSARILLPGSIVYQYVLSGVTGIFMAQFIYQMHGLFEMHFFAFIGSIIMITYRNWKLQLPLAMVVIIHHAVFGYLQFAGFDKIYFTQLEFMSLHTFIMHGLLTVSIFTLSGLWAYNFKKSSLTHIAQSFEIGKLQEACAQREAFVDLNANLKKSNELLHQANYELEIIFNSIDAVLFSIDMIKGSFIHISAACEKTYGYTAADFMADAELWLKMVYPDDRAISPGYDEKYYNGKPVSYKYRIIHKDKTIRWLETSLVPATNQKGTIIRIDGICNEITERIKLEAMLAEEIKLKQREITAAVITAQEKERYFLGEELHDNINPTLATARLYIDCAMSGDERFTNLLADSKEFISTAIEEIRTLSKSLIPPSLGEIGLADAIMELVENLKMINNLEFITDLDNLDESILSKNLKLTVFRIVQEQMTNILKHADASTIWLKLYQTEGKLFLLLKDDGVGFDLEQKRKGVGLQNITSRTELSNGMVDINSSPGNGCELMVTFTLAHHLNCISPGIRA